MDNFVALYITAKERKEAEKIGDMLLKKRLAGCINMWPCSSSYRWKDKLKRDNEIILIAKTKESLAVKALDEIKAIHSYEVPCINVMRISEGNPHWLSWLESEL